MQYALKHGAKDDTIRALVMAGADVNVCDSERKTPFLLAAEHCNADIVKIMINNGADVTVRDKNNSTALHLAVEHNTSADVIAVLIEGGADVLALDGEQRTPLHLAISKNCDAEVVGALLVPVAGNVESHELNEFLDFVERSRGQGQGLDRLETLLLLAVRNKASAWIVSSLINIGAHHYILLQGTTPPWWQR